LRFVSNELKNVISKLGRLYVNKHRSYNLFHIIFPPILRLPMAAV